MGKDKKSNKFTPDMITDECRIVTVSGKVIAGSPVGWFDDAVVVNSVSSDTVIVRIEAIESIWDGLVSPRQKEALEGGKKDAGEETKG